MGETVSANRTHTGGLKTLKTVAALWFIVAVLGQLVFAAYVIANYGGDAVRGDVRAWNETLIHGIVLGDPIGNAAVATHLLLAAIITICGPLQLVPQVRASAPVFHRWNGRVYLFTAFAASLGGLYMIWTRGTLGGLVNQVAISGNALLIMLCATMALRHALRREFDTHRRWATRLFLVVSGVWFFRVGLMAWIAVNGGPVGVGEELDGPFAISWAYGQYLLPLAVYEIYLRAIDSGAAPGRLAAAGLISALTLLMGVGIVMATLFMWLPRV
jgi:hypothetical protein